MSTSRSTATWSPPPEDHPFWNATDGEWQEAQDLDIGDQVRTAEKKFVEVGGLRLQTARMTAAFNLTVDGIHTYFVAVGEDEVLVHNTCGMLGARGTQVTSKTLANRPGYRIDVENPAPGVRPGQLHLQDSAAANTGSSRWSGEKRHGGRDAGCPVRGLHPLFADVWAAQDGCGH